VTNSVAPPSLAAWIETINNSSTNKRKNVVAPPSLAARIETLELPVQQTAQSCAASSGGAD